MPIVTIQVTREGTKPGVDSATAEEKAAPIKGASELLLGVLNKPLDHSSASGRRRSSGIGSSVRNSGRVTMSSMPFRITGRAASNSTSS
jgi:hypothetical protein